LVDSIKPFSSKLGGQTGLTFYEKKIEQRLSDIAEYFSDKELVEQMLSRGDDPVIYEVYEVPQQPTEGVLNIGCTIIYPGKIGVEYYFTKGHFHEKKSSSEVYIGMEGEGLILMQDQKGKTMHLEIKPDVLVYIPPGSAHRSINTGTGKLVFLAVYPSDAGHDYGTIRTRGFAKLVIERDGKPVLIDNPY